MAPDAETPAAGSSSEPAAAAPAATFEDVMARLAKVVGELEAGDLPLERALVLFEEGVRLSRQGSDRLDRAEARIEELLGKEGLRPLDPRELRADAGAARPTKEPR